MLPEQENILYCREKVGFPGKGRPGGEGMKKFLLILKFFEKKN